MEKLFSTCIRKFSSTADEIELHHWSAMTKHLDQICNIRISYPDKEILIFYEDTSREFRHAKLHLQVALDYAQSSSQNLYTPTR